MKSRALAMLAALVVLTLGVSSAAIAQSQTTTAPSSQSHVPDVQAPPDTPQTAPPQTPQAAPQQQPSTPAPDATSQPTAAQEESPSPYPEDQPGAKKDKEAKKEKHDGGKNDIDAIGNRDIGSGKKSLGNWYSLESEIKMGKQYAQMVESSSKMIQDPVVNEYVNRIGQNIVRNSDAKVPFTIKVVDSDEINAFALPGGFFYVNSGLILAADEEAELAGVMAHEIAHVALRHATRQMTRGNLANLATVPLIFVGGGLGYALQSAAGLALPATFLKFSRGFEAQADYFGLEYMYKSGYDPQAFISFFEKIQAKEKKKPGSLAKAFATHPQTPDRISATQKEIAEVLPAKDQYIVSTSEFDQVKARLAAIENRRKLQDSNDKDKPSLRRASADDKNPNSGKKSGDDDRPTLKRRDD
jgi:predicted Zn-dependent protease